MASSSSQKAHARVSFRREACLRIRPDQRIFGAAKKAGIGGGEPRAFAAGHGMAAKKSRAAGEVSLGGGADGTLGAGGVGNQGPVQRVARNFGQSLDGHANGQSDIDQIGAGDGFSQVGVRFIHYAGVNGALQHVRLVPADDAGAGKRGSDGQGEGAADESGADDGDARKGWGHGQPCGGRRPARSCATRP